MFRADIADVVAMNVNVQSYKKLLEKNMLNDLSAPESADKSVKHTWFITEISCNFEMIPKDSMGENGWQNWGEKATLESNYASVIKSKMDNFSTVLSRTNLLGICNHSI